jgi:hypothetical protein
VPGWPGENILAAGDQLDAGIAGLDDGQGRLAHDRALDGAGEHSLLGRIDAHRHDLDICLVGLGDLPEPVLQHGVGHRAGRLGSEARRLAGRGLVRLESGGRARARREELRQGRRCDEDVLAGRGRGDDTDVDAARAGDGERGDTGDIKVDRARGERLDHVRAGFEHRERRRDAGLLQPALAIGDEDRRGADDRDVADAGRDRLLGASTERQRGSERRAGEQELAAVHDRNSPDGVCFQCY